MRTTVLSMCALLLLAGVAAAKPTADEAAMAREHYKRGTTLYDLGKYDEAIVEFQQAYEIKDDPVLLYNIAQSFRLASKYNEALRFYRTYLRRAPKAPNRDEVETKIADMENLIAQQEKVKTSPSVDPIRPKGETPAAIGAKPVDPPVARTEPAPKPAQPRPVDEDEKEPSPPAAAKTEPPPPAQTEPTSESPPTEVKRGNKTMLIAGVVVAALGLGAAGAGIGMGVLAMNKGKDQEKAPTYDPNLESSGKMFQTVGLALDVAGGVLVVAGVVVAVLGVTRKVEQPKVTFLPSVGRGSAGAALNVSF